MDAGGTPGAGPKVCPFVALADDRDRRADGPDPRNRCYAEPHPRQRDEAYQASYCYSARFADCGVFLGWAARNAAEPAYVVPGPTPGGSEPWPGPAGDQGGEAGALAAGAGAVDAGVPPDGGGAVIRGSGETLDWVSASAWADVPAAEAEADEGGDEDVGAEALPGAEGPSEPGSEGASGRSGEAGGAEPTRGPRVPAALPMRRRRRPQAPIRTRGSGEWFYSDPPDRQPLVRRRFAVAPPVALGALGLLVVAIVVFLLPGLLGSSDPGLVGAAASGSPAATERPATPRPAATRAPDESEPATPEPTPTIREYRVRAGDTLSGIASRFGVRQQVLQCRNLIRNANLLSIGQVLTIPPADYVCPPGWRRATPTPALAPIGSPVSPSVEEDPGSGLEE
jgi:LysM repeat protein